jgi:ATPase subunit of ABC transporter with duplicated ATPase domains
VDRIVELDDGGLTEYLGSFTYYVEEKARRARGEPAYVIADEAEQAEYETQNRARKNARGK